MAWEQILGFFTMWLHPEITVSLWSKAGVPLWQTFLFASYWTSITLSITYFGIGWLKKWVKNFVKNIKNAEALIGKLEFLYQESNLNNGRYQKRVLKWLARQKNWIILMCSFVPFVYGLPAMVIIMAKLLEIRHAFPFLFLGNIFRNAAICLLIYQGFKVFS